jgi:hypothetical protein
MKIKSKKTDRPVRTIRALARTSNPGIIAPRVANCTFDAVAYAAALEVLG